jgi:hypothetical protein
VKVWGDEPFWGVGDEWDPDRLLTARLLAEADAAEQEPTAGEATRP